VFAAWVGVGMTCPSSHRGSNRDYTGTTETRVLNLNAQYAVLIICQLQIFYVKLKKQPHSRLGRCRKGRGTRYSYYFTWVK